MCASPVRYVYICMYMYMCVYIYIYIYIYEYMMVVCASPVRDFELGFSAYGMHESTNGQKAHKYIHTYIHTHTQPGVMSFSPPAISQRFLVDWDTTLT